MLLRHQCQAQYQQYINRYGPGMVIYWFGFIDELAHETQDLLIMGSFPTTSMLTMLPALPLLDALLLLGPA